MSNEHVKSLPFTQGGGGGAIAFAVSTGLPFRAIFVPQNVKLRLQMPGLQIAIVEHFSTNVATQIVIGRISLRFVAEKRVLRLHGDSFR